MARLNDKVALISGAATGIGLCTAQLMIDEGARVVITDRNVEGGEAAAEGLGSQARFIQQDVCDEESWKQVFDSVQNLHGKVDILVNNAGILTTEPVQDIEQTSLAQWQAIQSVNVEGVFLGCRAGVQAMKDFGGSIVNLSSVAGLIATPSLVAYGASKAAVRQLTKSVAIHCGRMGYRIRCNSVHPDPIRTDMGNELMELKGYIEGPDIETNWQTARKRVPIGETGEPIDVAQCILFLASDESRHVTGSELVVDGGLTAT